jgi:antitoxin ParD1/3/4
MGAAGRACACVRKIDVRWRGHTVDGRHHGPSASPANLPGSPSDEHESPVKVPRNNGRSSLNSHASAAPSRPRLSPPARRARPPCDHPSSDSASVSTARAHIIGIICQSRYDLGVPTRNVVLTDNQEHLIQSLVECGRYQNASEVIREGLRLIERREAEDAAKLEALRAAAAAGITAIEAGAYREFLKPGSLQTYLSAISDGVVETRKPAP